ncbi:MAG: hypothetical protein HY517_00460 [Candidatus Aenigmarchaeota archaeon]|nr:hypothetical protein [Candidatus Aenigmarchaeota archaeon]
MDNDLIRAKILFALARHRKWGESHTAYENMMRQFRSQMLGKEGMKIATKIAEELIREGFIIKKPTHYGLQVSLNPKKSQEIKEIIRKNIGFDL